MKAQKASSDIDGFFYRQEKNNMVEKKFHQS